MNSNQAFASPTESEFSDVEGPESAKNWDEERVCDWLVSVNCGDYEKLFRKNNINGENLLEMDKAVLQEMGIDKIGDRVRLFLNIKKLRTKAYANQKKRNRVCLHNLFRCDVLDTDVTRTPSLDSMLTPPPHLAPLVRQIREVELYPHHQPTKDIRDSLKASILLQPFPKMLASLLHDQVLPSRQQKLEP